jgi:hypothetical protein
VAASDAFDRIRGQMLEQLQAAKWTKEPAKPEPVKEETKK